ncbi:MAG: glycoside hydrolase family 88 protein [Bryobacteraceae bacterium]|nr:glycoside hydrolase family 88 protein [Bryobacteraceae bacterium]
MDFAQSQVRKLIEQQPDFHPMYTEGGRWKLEHAVWTRWCDGFFPGMMWIFHRHVGPGSSEADWWMDQAIRYSRPLEVHKFDRDTHDLGFLFLPTYSRWYQVSHHADVNETLVQAGQTLANRFQDRGGYLPSFAAENSIYIDIMMNVGLIFYAARETEDRFLRDIAVRHSLTTRKVLVRGDGSVAHEGIFDLNTGEFLHHATQQGARSDSCWARGLAWALYGFTISYDYSRDPRFLETAQACADYYITHAGVDGIPPWDFNAPPESRKIVDTSAAAIAAAGILRLYRAMTDPMKAHFYWSTGLRIVRALCERYVAKDIPGWEGVVTGGVYHLHKDLGVNESNIWGDYYFVEALEMIMRRLAA